MLCHRCFRALFVLILIAVLGGVCNFAQAKDKSPGDKSTANAPPADAQWTLYCAAVDGPGHIEQANSVKAQLIKLTGDQGLRNWYVIHQDTQSVLYYGFYRTIDDPKDKKETQRAQADRQRIAALTDQQGNKLFKHVFFVQVNAPDPTAPPEWNLCNADGYWSLEIAAYKDSPHRKEAAVESVRAARAQGIQAYYYHGDSISSVCIGAWPKSAVRDGDDAVEAPASAQEVIVLPHAIPGMDQMQFRSRETGERIRTVAPESKIIDPSLQAMMAKYPTHSVNGLVMENKVKQQDGSFKTVQDPSFVVKIPHPEASILTQSDEPPAPQLLNPTGAQSTPGEGKLKSIGDQ
jgi:hypothetical protein